MKTVLALAQTYCRLNALAIPSTMFAATTNTAAQQMMEVINKVGRDIRDRMDWQVLKRRVTFNSVATEDQGLLSTLLGQDPTYVIPQTLFDNTTRLPIYGPLSDLQYQQTKALLPMGPLYQFKIYQGHLYITGSIAAGHVLTMMYTSKAWLQTTSVSAVFVEEVAADVNVPVFDDTLMLLGMDYHYKKVRELPFQDAMADFEAKLIDFQGRDNIKPVVNMSGPNQPLVRPAILVPAGSWDIVTPP